MKPFILLGLLFSGISLAAYFAGRLHDAPADSLAGHRQTLAVLRVQKDIERLKIRQEEEKRETAVTLARLENARRIESASPVVISGIVSATLTRLFPVVLFVSLAGGAFVFLVVRRIPFEFSGIKTTLSAREVSQVVEAAVHVQALAESGKVLSFQEEISRARLHDAALLVKTLRNATNTSGASPLAIPEETAVSNPSNHIPSMQQLLESLHAGDPLVLGYEYETGNPVTGTFDALYSSFLAGRSGSGKSSWLRGLILQSLVCYPEARFFVLDPHAEHDESLSKSLPRTEHFQFIDAAKPTADLYRFNRILQERLDVPARYAPAVLVVDEMSFCSRQKYAPTLQGVLERVANEGRKAKVYALLSSQDTRARKTGDFRDMLSSSYIFQIKPAHARYLLQDHDEVEKVKQIQGRGVALFSPTDNESRLVRVPFCSSQDVHFIESRFTSNSLKSPLERPEQPERSLEQAPIQCVQVSVQASVQDGFRQRMTACGITQNRLALLAGVPKSSLSVYLNGGNMEQEKIDRIEHALNSMEEQTATRSA